MAVAAAPAKLLSLMPAVDGKYQSNFGVGESALKRRNYDKFRQPGLISW
jgi:hypothetical protein